jgi:hypothetical protein
MCGIGVPRFGSYYCPLCFDRFADRYVRDHILGKVPKLAQQSVIKQEQINSCAKLAAAREIPFCQLPIADEPSTGPVSSPFEREPCGLPAGALFGYNADEARAYWAALNDPACIDTVVQSCEQSGPIYTEEEV